MCCRRHPFAGGCIMETGVAALHACVRFRFLAGRWPKVQESSHVCRISCSHPQGSTRSASGISSRTLAATPPRPRYSGKRRRAHVPRSLSRALAQAAGATPALRKPPSCGRGTATCASTTGAAALALCRRNSPLRTPLLRAEGRFSPRAAQARPCPGRVGGEGGRRRASRGAGARLHRHRRRPLRLCALRLVPRSPVARGAPNLCFPAPEQKPAARLA